MKRKPPQSKFRPYLEIPFKPFKHRSVNYRDGFYLDLVKGIIRSITSQIKETTRKLRALNITSVARRRVVSFLRWLTTPLFLISFFLTLFFWPNHHRVIYADPSPTPPAARIVIKDLPKITKDPVLPQVEEVPVPAPPAPQPVYTAPVSYGDARSYALNQVGGAQFSCLDALWNKESGWRVDAYNPSGAYGIPQSLPGSKMASAGADWQTNPITQVNWGLSYIAAVYGTPCGAWGHSVAFNWY